MEPKKCLTFFLFCVFMLFLAASLLSCQSISLNYVGTAVPEQKHIPLKTGSPQEGTWQTMDITVQYRYQCNADNLALEGLVDFSDSLKDFNILKYFDLWIHLIGPDGTIIVSKNISPQAYYYEIIATPFKTNLPLPADTRAFVFSYSGLASDGGGRRTGLGNDRSEWKFWQTPHG